MVMSRLCKTWAVAISGAVVSGHGDEGCVNGDVHDAHVSLLQTGAAMTKPQQKADGKSETGGKLKEASSTDRTAWFDGHFEDGTDRDSQSSLLSHLVASKAQLEHLATAARGLDDRHKSHKFHTAHGSATAPTDVPPSNLLNAGVGSAPSWRSSLDSFLQDVDQQQVPKEMSVVSTKKKVLSKDVGSVADGTHPREKTHGSRQHEQRYAHALEKLDGNWITLDAVQGEESMSRRAKEAASKYRERINKARESGDAYFIHGGLQDPVDDEDIPSCMHSIDLSRARLIHNNLGGHGPDDGMPTMVFSNVVHQDQKVNLEVTALSDYRPRNTANNALVNQFGVINLETGTNATLRFTFIDPETDDYIEMPAFFFSFFDLDHGRSHGSRESIDVHGFNTFALTGTTEVQVDRRDEDDASFVSSMAGNKLDNPLMSRSLTQLQQERTVTLLFPSGLTHFDVTLREVGYVHVQGRNFFFAGPSSLVCNEQETCALFLCPNGYRRRMNSEFTICRGGHECNDQQDLELCCLEDGSSA
jgi:hypothetical protein